MGGGQEDTDRVLRSIDDLLEPGVVGRDAQFPDAMRWEPAPQDGEAPFDPAQPLDRLRMWGETEETTTQRAAPPSTLVGASIRITVLRLAEEVRLLYGLGAEQRFLDESAEAVDAAVAAVGEPNAEGMYTPNLTAVFEGFERIARAYRAAHARAMQHWVAVIGEATAARNAAISEALSRARLDGIRLGYDPYLDVVTIVGEQRHRPTRADLLAARRNRNTGPSNPHGIDGRARRHQHQARAASERAVPRNPRATHGAATPEHRPGRSGHWSFHRGEPGLLPRDRRQPSGATEPEQPPQAVTGGWVAPPAWMYEQFRWGCRW